MKPYRNIRYFALKIKHASRVILIAIFLHLLVKSASSSRTYQSLVLIFLFFNKDEYCTGHYGKSIIKKLLGILKRKLVYLLLFLKNKIVWIVRFPWALEIVINPFYRFVFKNPNNHEMNTIVLTLNIAKSVVTKLQRHCHEKVCPTSEFFSL